MDFLIVNILLIAVLLAVVVEDFRYRHVHLYLLIAGFAGMVVKFRVESNELSYLLINAGFVMFQLFSIALYVMLRYRRIAAMSTIIGWGDIIIWGLLIFGFSPLNFIVFFIISLVFSLAIFKLFMTGKIPTVPLAGLQGLCYVFVLVVNLLGVDYDFYSDYHLLNYISYEY